MTINELIDQGAELVINFSGGKDSSAMLAYLCEAYPNVKKHVIFADTGWEHTDAEQWGRGIVSMFDLPLNVCRNPNKTFLTMVEKRRMFPGMQQRQCTSDLKRDPVLTWTRRNVKPDSKIIIQCMGHRSEESTERSKLTPLSLNKRNSNSKRTTYDWYPVHDWIDIRVLHYLQMNSIPLHPVYKYLRRFSCRICIYMSDHDLNQVAINDPEAINIIDVLENKIGFTMFQRGPIKSLITTSTI